MTRRRSRLGEEERGYKAPAEGAAVFPSSKSDSRPEVLIPVGGKLLRCRWPAATARAQTGEAEVIPTETIVMADKARVTVTLEDPYERAERLAAERRGAA